MWWICYWFLAWIVISFLLIWLRFVFLLILKAYDLFIYMNLRFLIGCCLIFAEAVDIMGLHGGSYIITLRQLYLVFALFFFSVAKILISMGFDVQNLLPILWDKKNGRQTRVLVRVLVLTPILKIILYSNPLSMSFTHMYNTNEWQLLLSPTKKKNKIRVYWHVIKIMKILGVLYLRNENFCGLHVFWHL